jgi:hypothetical protein
MNAAPIEIQCSLPDPIDRAAIDTCSGRVVLLADARDRVEVVRQPDPAKRIRQAGNPGQRRDVNHS